MVVGIHVILLTFRRPFCYLCKTIGVNIHPLFVFNYVINDVFSFLLKSFSTTPNKMKSWKNPSPWIKSRSKVNVLYAYLAGKYPYYLKIEHIIEACSTNFWPTFPFYTLWKYQKAVGSLVFPGVAKRKRWPEFC